MLIFYKFYLFISHIRSQHLDFKGTILDNVREFCYKTDLNCENPVLLANKFCSVVKLDHPISSILNSFLKGNILNSEISNAHNRMMDIISPHVQESSPKIPTIYFRFNKKTVEEAISKFEELNDIHCFTSLRRGYIGSTGNPDSRKIDHYASRNEVHHVDIELVPLAHLEEVVESIIIKIINRLNCINNWNFGVNYFIKGLSPKDHVFVGIYYLKEAIGELKSTTFGPQCSFLDFPASQSSQETIGNFVDNFKFESASLSDYSITNLIELKNSNLISFNVAIKCASNTNRNQYGLHFDVQDLTDGYTIRVIHNGNDMDCLQELLRKDQRYIFTDVSIDQSSAFRIYLNNKEQVKLIHDRPLSTIGEF